MDKNPCFSWWTSLGKNLSKLSINQKRSEKNRSTVGHVDLLVVDWTKCNTDADQLRFELDQLCQDNQRGPFHRSGCLQPVLEARPCHHCPRRLRSHRELPPQRHQGLPRHPSRPRQEKAVWEGSLSPRQSSSPNQPVPQVERQRWTPTARRTVTSGGSRCSATISKPGPQQRPT